MTDDYEKALSDGAKNVAGLMDHFEREEVQTIVEDFVVVVTAYVKVLNHLGVDKETIISSGAGMCATALFDAMEKV
jgi:preprotein translocase subunit Sec61beta